MQNNPVHKSNAGWNAFQSRTNNGRNKRPAMMTRNHFVTPKMRENRKVRNA